MSKAPAKMNFAEQRAKMKANMAAAKRGPPKPLDVKGDPIKGFKPNPDEPMKTMNDLVDSIDGAIKKHRSALGEATANQSKSTQQMVGTAYYFTVVFDTEAQRNAFIGKLKMKCHLSETGGLFLDGREIADALGIEIPAAEHKLTKKAFRATGMTAQASVLGKTPKTSKRAKK